MEFVNFDSSDASSIFENHFRRLIGRKEKFPRCHGYLGEMNVIILPEHIGDIGVSDT